MKKNEKSHPGGSRNTPSRLMQLKPELSAGLMDRLWPICRLYLLSEFSQRVRLLKEQVRI